LGFSPGTFLSTGSTVVTEIAAQYPFKWLLLDMEHGSLTESTLVDHLRIFTHKEIVSIVRVPSIDPVLIGKVLDAGADGIMVPHVVSAEQITACKKAMYYQPRGNRGFSSSTRQYSFGTHVPEDISNANKPLLFAQIEDVEGVLNAKNIAAIEEVDVLFVGPSDLKLSLKYHALSDLNYEEALEIVANSASEKRKKAGILLRDRKLVSHVKELGYTCIAIDSDIAILRSGYQCIMEDLS
jgi:2-dehydro-3-deoxyglucarate aldolase/4-hydroxy-2-oxoheptanedioate aldolase